MEVKLSLSLTQKLPHLFLPLSFHSKSNFPSHSVYQKSWSESEKSLQKRIRSNIKKWRLRIQEISDGQSSVKDYSVHVVEEGETLTSIAKQYGVSIYAIAVANKKIVDIDLVYQGQYLNIPPAPKNILVAAKSWSANFKLPEKVRDCLNASNGVIQPKNFSVLYSRFVPHGYPSYYQARTVASFLVLVPLFVFCIRCIAGAIHARAVTKSRHQSTNDSSLNHRRSGSGRWKSALGEAWEPDLMDTEPIPDPLEKHSDDQDQISHEEESHAYRKLEHDYQEFLAQCGMSKFGYWRGGSPR